MDDLLTNFTDLSTMSSFAMDDTKNNFTDHEIESPNEEGYKYHFLDGSPAGSEHEKSLPLVTAASAGLSNGGPFFDIEATASPQATAGVDEDEEDYNADLDDDDDDDHHGRGEATRYEAYGKNPSNGASYNENSLRENHTDDRDRKVHRQSSTTFAMRGVNDKGTYEQREPSPALSDDGQDASDDSSFARYLYRLHGQDKERDELLTQLHNENMEMKKVLRKTTPGCNPRAEAAERSLFEIRQTMHKSPYVYVLIDERGYKIHEDLLQAGKRGGADAAERLWTEVSNYLHQYGEVKDWEIMVHICIDVAGLLARCVSNDCPLSDDNVRDFMIGFTQARPLFTIVDVGSDPESLSRKVGGLFHLFADNVQCKHLIFGCCHNSAYATILEPYALNPITASQICLLKSYEDSPHFETLPFNSVVFPHVFRSTPFKETDRLGENDDYMQDISQPSGPSRTSREIKKDSTDETATPDKAIAKWQHAAKASVPFSTRVLPQTKTPYGWATEKNLLLNINDERVDHELEEVDYETSKRMTSRIKEQGYCAFYHLHRSCLALPEAKACNFRHGPRLNDDETRFLRRYYQRMPCVYGSNCRKADCHLGHVCFNQPGCKKGKLCSLYRFHGVDKIAVKIYSPERKVSPRRR